MFQYLFHFSKMSWIFFFQISKGFGTLMRKFTSALCMQLENRQLINFGKIRIQNKFVKLKKNQVCTWIKL